MKKRGEEEESGKQLKPQFLAPAMASKSGRKFRYQRFLRLASNCWRLSKL